jgi:hypothetical protein
MKGNDCDPKQPSAIQITQYTVHRSVWLWHPQNTDILQKYSSDTNPGVFLDIQQQSLFDVFPCCSEYKLDDSGHQ